MFSILVVVIAGYFSWAGNLHMLKNLPTMRTTGFSLGPICSASEHMGNQGDSESGFTLLPHRGHFSKLCVLINGRTARAT
jgi:hypothetical protein